MADQPDMQQSDHPEHNMPPTDRREHTDARSMLEDRNRTTEYSGEASDGSGTISWKGAK